MDFPGNSMCKKSSRYSQAFPNFPGVLATLSTLPCIIVGGGGGGGGEGPVLRFLMPKNGTIKYASLKIYEVTKQKCFCKFPQETLLGPLHP